MTVFERLRHAGEVEDAVRDTLQIWLSTYLREVERQEGLGYELENPLGYAYGERWPEDQLPCVVIGVRASTEIAKSGERWRHRVTWPVDVTVVLSADTESNARHNAFRYNRAVAGALMQHRSLERLVDGERESADMRATAWISEDPAAQDPDMRRSLYGARNTFAIEMDEVLSAQGGPPSPDDIPEDWVLVDTIVIETEPHPITGPLTG